MDHSKMEHGHDGQHEHHNHSEENLTFEYIKFAFVILGIIVLSFGLYLSFGNTFKDWMRMFMGVFFAVFGLFKLLDLNGFVDSFIGYDVIAKRSTFYAKLYPFIELGLAAMYFGGLMVVNFIVLPLMLIGAYGVTKQLARKSSIKCACLGTYIKLPLTTVSLTEDLLMAAMALYMILI